MKREIARRCEKESGSFERGGGRAHKCQPCSQRMGGKLPCPVPEGGDDLDVSLMCHLRLNPFVTRPRTAKLFLNQLDQSISILTICTNEGLPTPV